LPKLAVDAPSAAPHPGEPRGGRSGLTRLALGLFDNPYVAEDSVEIRTRASEGDELSRRLADESVTLLKNNDGLLPLGRDVAKVVVIGQTRTINGEDRAFLSAATVGS
jgi:beta-glucosidase-like glycosyl hydrolase